MKRKPLLIFHTWLCIFLAWSIVSATDQPRTPVNEQLVSGPSLADLTAYAIRHNPDIQAARLGWEAEIEEYGITTGYPDPQLMVTYFTDPIETRLGPQDWSAQISQLIPFPGKLSKKGEIVAARARIARLNLDKTIRQTITALRTSFHELAYIRQALEIAERNRELLEHIRKTGETAYARDQATLTDVAKAQAQTGQLAYDILLLTELEQTEATTLNSLLNRPPAARIGPLGDVAAAPLTYSLEQIFTFVENNQEEIRIAQQKINQAEAGKDLALYENLPDFKVGFSYADIGEPDVATQPPDAGRDAVGIQAGISVPLWFGKNKSRMDKARLELRQARKNKESNINSARAGARSLYFKVNNALRLVTLYADQLLPQATQSMVTAETWYREGEGSFSDFIENQATLYNFQVSLARARADYGKYLAALEGLAGRKLTGINETDRKTEDEK